MAYKKLKHPNNALREDMIYRDSDGAFIPCVAGNKDYEKFKKDWLNSGKTIDELSAMTA